MHVVQAEIVVGWHRLRFKYDWTWKCLHKEQSRIDHELVRFLRLTRDQIRIYAQRENPTGDMSFMVAGNANVDALLNLLDSLLADISAGALVVRFDQPASGNATASREELRNLIHLRPFSNDSEKTEVAAGMVHEYTHGLQDQAVEFQMRTNSGVEHDADDE